MEVPDNIKINRRLDKFEKALKELKKQIQILQDKDKDYKRVHRCKFVKTNVTANGCCTWKCSSCPKTVKSM